MFNFVNPKQYTSDQILEKIAELHKRINFFSYSSNGAVESLYSMLETFENEYRERQFMENWKLVAPMANKPIETEPDLKNDNYSSEDNKKDKPKRNRISIPPRSEKPIVPDKD